MAKKKIKEKLEIKEKVKSEIVPDKLKDRFFELKKQQSKTK